MMIDVIKEYLVSLGMQVDRNSFSEANQTMQTLESGVKSFAGSTIKGFALAGTAIVSALASANIGIYAFLGSLAKADLENEKFARQMWLSKDAAAELNSTLKAMGATVEDLYLSPELLRNFQQLRATIKDMKPPAEFQDQMKTVRSVQFEFKRMRLEATYALQWVGFYLFKYLEGPIKNIKGGLQGFNDAIIKSMPRWTKNVAQFLSWIARLGIALFKGGRDVFRLFSKLGDHIPDKMKLIGAALLGLAFILKTGPFGIVFAILTGILLLLDDFYTYLEGGESALGPLWKKLVDFFNMLKDTGVIERFEKAFADVIRTIEEGLQRGWAWLERLYEKIRDSGAIESFKRSFVSVFLLLFIIIQGFWDWLMGFFNDLNDDNTLSGLIESVFNLGKEVAETIAWVAELVSAFLELQVVQDVLSGIGDFLSGTLKATIESVKLSIDSLVNGLKIARAWLKDDEDGLQEALEERQELSERTKERTAYYGGKISEGIYNLFVDPNGQSSEKQSEKLNSSVNNLPRNIEPSFKKAINESEIVKGFRTFNQDLNNGFARMAMMINPDLFQQYEALAGGAYANSYMYSTNNTTTRQTLIYNTGNPIFQIHSTDAKGAAQEVSEQWGQFNLRSMRNSY